jgi:hypothetical protein
MLYASLLRNRNVEHSRREMSIRTNHVYDIQLTGGKAYLIVPVFLATEDRERLRELLASVLADKPVPTALSQEIGRIRDEFNAKHRGRGS